MTNADTAAHGTSGGGSSSVRRRRIGRGSGKSKRILIGQIVMIATVVIVVLTVYRFQSPASSDVGEGDGDGNGNGDDSLAARYPRRSVETSDGAPLPLAKFSSLSYALANTDLVGLYFAAAWCPMSTPVTNDLESAFSGGKAAGTLLVPGDETLTEKVHRPLAIVYVSSDKSDEEMKRYSHEKGWINVPYDSPERNDVKRHFRVCAKRELEELGFDRKMEIPTLIIIDSVTQGVLTTSGASDLKEYGDKAIDHWLGLQTLIRSLEDKYEDEESARERERRPEPRIV